MTKLIILYTMVTILSIVTSKQHGLRSKDGRNMQLLSLHTRALIEGPYAEIQHTQTYTNPYDSALETEFYFPRTDSSIFHKFQAVLRDKVIVGEILEKQEAKQKYEWNVKQGNTVAYSEKNTLTPDVMQILVGNIPAHESVKIIFSVMQPLDIVVNKFWGLTLPSVLTEHYTPSSVDISQTPNIQTVSVEDSLYKEWKIEVEVKADSKFTYILNPSHHIGPVISETISGASSKVYKAVWNSTIVPDKDFIIYFKNQDTSTPETVLAEHPEYPNDYVMLVNFLPELNTLDIDIVQQKLENGDEGILELNKLVLEEDIYSTRAEFIFVIDRSGSMGGNRIKNLQKALIKFLQILPRDSLFNIVSFGSSFSLYRPESMKYTPENVQTIISWIHTIGADMGGTEILPSLKHITSIPLIEEYPRTIIVLTDGDVFNPNEVISHTLANSDKMRFCAVGIGHGASEYLVKNLANAGKCTSEFVKDDEDIGDKANYIVKAAVSQYLQSITLHTQCYDNNNEQVFVETKNLGILLKDQPFKQWVYLTNIPHIKSCDVLVDYYDSLKGQKMMMKFAVDGFEWAEKTDIWHKAAYDSQMKDLDLKVKSGEVGYAGVMNKIDELRSEIVRLSIKYQVLSDYTAFLAVVEESVVDPEEETVKALIPSIQSQDYTAETVRATGVAGGTTAGTGIGSTGTTTGATTGTVRGTATGAGIGSTGTTTGVTTGTTTPSSLSIQQSQSLDHVNRKVYTGNNNQYAVSESQDDYSSKSATTILTFLQIFCWFAILQFLYTIL